MDKKQSFQLVKELVKRNEKAEYVLLDFCQKQEPRDQAFVLAIFLLHRVLKQK
ncbi:MAG TPA: hypothetical protein H9829_09185 [Candidatus Tetragenococcus pullicola]|nr:hypothetical protein [Candidatus Tetragenococcus pullicola]